MIPPALILGLPPAPRRVSSATEHKALPVWSSRDQWLLASNLAALSPAGRDYRRRLGGLSVRSFMAVMRVDALTADHLTGKNVFTSHATAARRCGLPHSTVKRARQVAEKLGLTVTTDPGRYLSKDERYEAFHATGRTYWRKASTRVLTISRRMAVALTDQLPRRGSNTSSLPKIVKPKRSRATASKKQIPPLDTRIFAANLHAEIFWLKNFGHMNNLARLLSSSGLDLERWTPRSLLRALDQTSKDLGWKPLSAPQNPLGYLKFLLGRLSTTTPPPSPEEAAMRRRAAMDATARARQRLEALSSDSHREAVSRGVQMLRDALRASRKANGNAS